MANLQPIKPIQIRKLKDDYFNFLYRCPICGTLFSNMTKFECYDLYDAIPKQCPNCCIPFVDGGKEI